MPENEKYLEMPWSIEDTIENLKIIKEHLGATVLKTNLDGKGKQDAKEVEFDFDRAIKALEEIQQYRELGTVEEILKVFNNQRIIIATQHETLKQYRAIGTIEEFKALKVKSVAKKPKMIGYRKDGEPVRECGCCGSTLKVADQPYCMICGGKVDWQ